MSVIHYVIKTPYLFLLNHDYQTQPHAAPQMGREWANPSSDLMNSHVCVLRAKSAGYPDSRPVIAAPNLAKGCLPCCTPSGVWQMALCLLEASFWQAAFDSGEIAPLQWFVSGILRLEKLNKKKKHPLSTLINRNT